MSQDAAFPAATYAETVLAINFADTQRYFLDALLDIHYAHTLMLARQGIISHDVARRCLEGLDALDRAEPSSARFEEVTRDLNAGSRYLSNRSGGSMMCMSQSTNR